MCYVVCLGMLNICNPDNHIEVTSLETPFHIVPEWYFLSFYTMLKVIPNKLLGLICFVTSIMCYLVLYELRNACSVSRLICIMFNMDNLSVCLLLLMFVYQVWLGVFLCVEVYIV